MVREGVCASIGCGEEGGPEVRKIATQLVSYLADRNRVEIKGELSYRGRRACDEKDTKRTEDFAEDESMGGGELKRGTSKGMRTLLTPPEIPYIQTQLVLRFLEPAYGLDNRQPPISNSEATRIL